MRGIPNHPVEVSKHDLAPPKALSFAINAKTYYHDGDPAMPLLWFLRDVLRLTGTKYGCGIGACGACTVLVDGKAARACMATMKSMDGRAITTIEGLETNTLHPLQQAWIEQDAVLCGYCQTGQIMAAADLLRRKPKPGADDIATITNLCRCGAYPRIRKAIVRAAELIGAQDK